MAFEDRSSPDTASGPANESALSLNSPNSPESTRTSPYTCTTIPHQTDGGPECPPNGNYALQKDHELGFFRITSYACSPKHERESESPKGEPSAKYLMSTNFLRANERSLNFLAGEHKAADDYIVKSRQEFLRQHDLLASPNSYLRSDCDSVNSYNHSESSASPPPRNEEEPTIQTLKYSIRNILQPDFGKNAVLKTKIKSAPKITFKPYENDEKPFATAPLGSLCQTVSQIGKLQPDSPRSKSPMTKVSSVTSEEGKSEDGKVPQLWPAWVYCTRYSDRPSSGPRSRRIKKPGPKPTSEDKRPRTAFSGAQLARLKHEFAENRYLTERRRQQLSQELGLNEAQIKIWFQNKRAKIKKASGQKNPLALQLMAQGLYNHSTVACDEDDLPMPT